MPPFKRHNSKGITQIPASRTSAVSKHSSLHIFQKCIHMHICTHVYTHRVGIDQCTYIGSLSSLAPPSPGPSTSYSFCKLHFQQGKRLCIAQSLVHVFGSPRCWVHNV
eukprot:1160395-Pelagomonas_calceolata.AAC.2